jgi:hypothetical protein
MLTKGIKTTDFYIIVALLAIWAVDYLGIDIALIATFLLNLSTAAVDVQGQLEELKGDKSSAGYSSAWPTCSAGRF